MICTAYHHGLRATEVTSLQSSDIADGFINVQRLKGSKRTIQPIQRHTDPLFDYAPALEKRAFTVSGSMWPMQGKHFWKICRKYHELAGIPRHKSCTKVLKHSIAMHSVERNVPLKALQVHLGHVSLASTGVYLEIPDEAASRAVAQAAGW